MSTNKLTVERYVTDDRDIAFYLYNSSNKNVVLTGSTLSCLFTATGESDVTTPIDLYSGDGRAHISVGSTQVAAAIVWKIMITGTTGAGSAISPITGTMTVKVA